MWIPVFLLVAAAQTSSPEPGMLQPAQATYSVAASGGSIQITVTRTVGTAGAVGCSFTTVDGTATAGTDYTAASGTLSWGDGDSSTRTVSISLLNPGVAGPDKTFYLQLISPTGGVFLGVAPSTPAVNQEGRVLGTTPGISASPTPPLWNTSTADAILQTLQILPANNPWNEDVSGLPVSADSDAIVASMGSGAFLHVNRDMNLAIVPGSQPTLAVTLTAYGSESDPGPYPVPPWIPIEDYLGDDPAPQRDLAGIQSDVGSRGGDRHATLIDPVNGFIYEFGTMQNTSTAPTYTWTASGEATFNLLSNTTRPAGWTSTDAAGLPILPSITRYDECQRGRVEHALRVTARQTRNQYVWPATHFASSLSGTNLPRMGERFRLKNNASVNGRIAAMHLHPTAIALALQKYGMFVADNGSDWFISTNSDPRLQNLNDLEVLQGSDFEVVVTTGPGEGPRSTSTAAITVTTGGGGGGGDTTPPTISITSPTTAASYSTTASAILFGGVAADNVAVASVAWNNSAGGHGIASGTTSWSAPVALAGGLNTVTFTAYDTGGNSTSATMTVISTPAPASGAAGAGGGGGGGGCGLLGAEFILLWFARRVGRGMSWGRLLRGCTIMRAAGEDRRHGGGP